PALLLDLGRARLAVRGRASRAGLELIPPRRGPTIRRMGHVPWTKRGTAEEDEPARADRQRAELHVLQPAAAEPAPLREAAADLPRRDQGGGPRREDRPRRHGGLPQPPRRRRDAGDEVPRPAVRTRGGEGLRRSPGPPL